MRERTITVDINKNYHKSLNYKQYDNNNVLNIIIKEDDNLVDITNYTARAFYQLPSKTVIQRNTTKNGKNTIKLKIDKVILAESGRISLEVVINNVDTVVTTFTLFIDVEKSIDRNEAIEGYPEWDIIADELSHLDDVKNRMSIAENEIVDIESEVSTVKNRVSTVEGEVADIKNEVTDARNGETSLKARLDRDIQNTEEKLNTTKNEVIDARNGETTLKVRLDKNIEQTEEKINIVKNEIIDARDGETSLKARLDKDIEKAKQVYVNVEGSNISTDSSSGYAKDVEILGNTIQDASNLADIRSVGDKVEGQELYEIPVLSSGKNLNDNPNLKITDNGNGYFNMVQGNFGKLKAGTLYTISLDITASSSSTNLKPRCVDKQNLTVLDVCENWGKIINGRYVVQYTPKTDGYLGFTGSNYNNTTLSNIQLEEGTVATPYEPYQEDKLTILSPVQLEKVGDVADRIIEKDGVWGVEKNVDTVILDGSDDFRYYLASSQPADTTLINIYVSRALAKASSSSSLISNRFTYNSKQEQEAGNCYLGGKSNVHFILDKAIVGDTTMFKSWLQENLTTLIYQLATPQFIPLPHSQQVKLRTFANKTNISFLTEIEGTIKAQVPKSLGATVNTHTEQIRSLNNELNRVKKLEESTVSTVTTESDFTTVEATSNGYFEDVKLEGKTLVNLCGGNFIKAGSSFSSNIINTTENMEISITTRGSAVLCKEAILKPNTTYTIIADVKIPVTTNFVTTRFSVYSKTSNSYTACGVDVVNKSTNGYAQYVTKITTQDEEYTRIAIGYHGGLDVGCILGVKNLITLEGDHTQNPPSYFEGLKSVGQSATTSEDGVGEIVVSSVNENLFDGEVILNAKFENNGSITQGDNAKGCVIGKNFIKVDSNFRYNLASNKNFRSYLVCEYDKYKNFICRKDSINENSLSQNCEYVKIYLYTNDTSLDLTNLQIMFTKGTTSKPYTPYQSDKKRLLYYNNETQTWEKPILRQWDSIEKHADGKYNYHQRSAEVVLNGSEDWKVDGYATANPNTQIFSASINGRAVGITNVICDKFLIYDYCHANDIESMAGFSNANAIRIRISNSKLITQDVAGFKQWLQANNVTVVYQLVQEKVYECTNIDLITYANETNYVVNSGVIAPKTTLKVMSNISNTVRELQRKVSTLESYIQYVMIDALNNALNE